MDNEKIVSNEEEKACGCGHEHDHHDHEHGDDCGCGHDHDHESFVVDLEDENGNVVSCPIVDAFDFEESEYVLVQDPNEDSMYLFKALEDGSLMMPDEEEFDRVSKFYSESLDAE